MSDEPPKIEEAPIEDRPGDTPAVAGLPIAETDAELAAAPVAPAVPDVAAAPDLPRARRTVLGLAIVSAVLLALCVLLGLMVFAPGAAPVKLGDTRLAAKAQQEQEIQTVANRFARNFLTVDYKTIDADFRRITADATGNFKQQLGRVLNVSRAQFESRKAASTGKVTESRVLQHDSTSATVRVVVQRTITNSGTGGPRSGVQVLDVTLVKTADGWKVDDLRQLTETTSQNSSPAPSQ